MKAALIQPAPLALCVLLIGSLSLLHGCTEAELAGADGAESVVADASPSEVNFAPQDLIITPQDSGLPGDHGGDGSGTGDQGSSPGDGSGEDDTSPPPVDGAVAPDGSAPELCEDFECPCTSNADCLDELCVEGPEGFICTEPCTTECPENYDCLAVVVGSGTDPVSVCIPRHVRLCRPCTTHAECQSAQASAPGQCVPAADPNDGNFCATSCANGVPCPEDYTCSTVDTGAGGSAELCLPDSGLCECQEGWADLGLETVCAVANTHGACAGTRQCGVEGLTSCAAEVPAPETCNGQDDDCDGSVDNIAGVGCVVENAYGSCPGTTTCAGEQEICVGPEALPESCNGVDDNCNGDTDEGTCNDLQDCTLDICDGAGGCTHEPIAGSCVIEEACVPNGALNPDNACLYCQGAINPEGWTGAPPEAACDDGNPCTSGDHCDGEGGCEGNPIDCNDGLSCTNDACLNGECVYTPVQACIINNSCVSAGTYNPLNPCERCTPSQSTSSWSPTSGPSCDDGNDCTSGDSCQAGACVGSPYSCNGSACTTSSCDGNGGCVESLINGWCEISGSCYSNGTTKPNDLCRVCNASSPNGWSYNNNASCDDGNGCTENDTCSNGSCAGSPIVDSKESNNSRGAASYLGSIDDSMNWPDEAGSFTASLYGSGDVDWYRYFDEDVAFANFFPRVELSNVPTGSNYKLCAAFSCEEGGTNLDCEAGTKVTLDGLPACCSDAGGSASETVELNPSCDCGFGCTDDSGTVYVRVTRTSGSWTCDPYTLRWGDN